MAVMFIWLILLCFPVWLAVTDVQTPVRRAAVLAATAVLTAAYVGATVRSLRSWPPRPAPVLVAVAAVVTLLLPAAGPAWLGGTVFVAALLGLTLRPVPALVGVGVTSAVAVGQAVVVGTAVPETLAVPLTTLAAGAVVVVVVRQTALARELTDASEAMAAGAAQAERMRLARELHDRVKQQAFVAALELASAHARYGPDEHIDAARDSVMSIQRQLVEVIEHLRPVDGRPVLVSQLRRYVEQWSRRTGVAVNLDVDPAVDGEGGAPSGPLFGVATEALTNVERHATANRVRIALRLEPGAVRLTVEDDGRGFDPDVTEPGQGQRGMLERMSEHDGTLEIDSGPRGTRVAATYPRF